MWWQEAEPHDDPGARAGAGDPALVPVTVLSPCSPQPAGPLLAEQGDLAAEMACKSLQSDVSQTHDFLPLA